MMMIDSEDDEFEEISKSQRKRDAEDIRQFAAQLVAASPQKIKKLSLPAPILEAIAACPPPQTRGAHKRHIQYIGKLIRNTGEFDQLKKQLNEPSATATGAENPHETICARLIESFTDHADTLLANYPDINLQQARQFARAAGKVDTTDSEDAKRTALKKAAKARQSLLRLLADNHAPDKL